MKSEIYKIIGIGSGSLSVMAKPVSEWIDDEFGHIQSSGITLVVSLLEEAEAYELGLRQEAAIAQRFGLGFLSFPIPDRGLPESVFKFVDFTRELYQRVIDGHHIAIHCRAGIGRSGLVAAAVLLHDGMIPEDAFALISEKRRVSVPDTREQKDWLIQHAEEFR